MSRSRFDPFVREQLIFAHPVTSRGCVHIDGALLLRTLRSSVLQHLIVFEVSLVHTLAGKRRHGRCVDILGSVC